MGSCAETSLHGRSRAAGTAAGTVRATVLPHGHHSAGPFGRRSPRASASAHTRSSSAVSEGQTIGGMRISRVFIIAGQGCDVEWIAHRGAAFEAPENSLQAFEEAIRQGAERIEFDVQQSADGVAVVCHDTNTLRSTGVAHEVELTPWAQLQALRLSNEEPLPTFEDACKVMSGRVEMDVELKSSQPHLVEDVLSTLARYDLLENALITSFDPEVLRLARLRRYEGRLGLLIGSRSLHLRQRAYEAWPLKAVAETRATDLVIHHRLAHRFLRQALDRMGCGLVLWTAMEDENATEAYRKALYLRCASLRPAGLIVARIAEAKAVVDQAV